jgi:hypothetical protein
MPTWLKATSRYPERRFRPASRADVITGLTRIGTDPAVARRWCELWEAEAARQGMAADGRYFWDGAMGWIDAHRSSTRPLG